MIQKGLQKLPRDDRDFTLGAFIGNVNYPKLTELPHDFRLTPLSIKNQTADGNDDACTGYATAGMKELQEEVVLSGPFSFAAGKSYGDPTTWGNDLRSAMKGAQKVGVAEEAKLTDADKALDQQKRRVLANFSEQSKDNAVTHRSLSYVTCKGPYDAFDNIRSALWMYKDEKRAVGIGVEWGWNTTDYILGGVPNSWGHMMYVVGWEGDYLVVVNSAGKEAGRDGIHLMARETINAFIPDYGAYMFIDHSADDVRKAIEANTNSKIPKQVFTALSLSGLISTYITWFTNWLLNKNTKYEIKQTEPEPPVVVQKISKLRLWAEAIEIFESGGKKDAPNYRRNNPGNIKGLDGKFLEFDSYQEGLEYLADYLVRAATNQHQAYVQKAAQLKLKSSGDLTIRQFIEVYTYGDSEEVQTNYSTFIASHCDVPINTPIKALL